MSSIALGSVFRDVGYFHKNSWRNSEGRRFWIRGSMASSPQGLQVANMRPKSSTKAVRVGVLGASGYTGAEIVRLLANHPQFCITLMTADRKAGQSFGSVFPHLVTQDLPDMVAVKDADFSNVDAVFCCLPHGTTQEIIKGLPNGLKIVDLSADFRLRNLGEYEEWYGQPHKAPELQKEVVYGLTEVWREKIQNARLVANPGCYPTSIQLPLIPLITGEEFVKLLDKGAVPHTRNVRGSNYCFMNVFPDRIPGRAIIISVIDNLVKGASGQALQNLNLMMGYPENLGLQQQPLFP